MKGDEGCIAAFLRCPRTFRQCSSTVSREPNRTPAGWPTSSACWRNMVWPTGWRAFATRNGCAATSRPSSFQRITNDSHEARIRLALTDLGTTFIKFGQILSTRPDIVSPALADELAKLQTDTPPDSPDVLRETIREELGKFPEELFAEFDPVPIASASIGQVHAGTLKDGRKIVVKVMRRGIQEKVARDLDLLAGLAELAERVLRAVESISADCDSPAVSQSTQPRAGLHGRATQPGGIQPELRDRAGGPFPGSPLPSLSSRRVLTMERLDGIRGLEVK